jgi:uncharacterized protein (TIGR02996 family)
MAAELETVAGVARGWLDHPAEHIRLGILRDAVLDYDPDPDRWLAAVLDDPAEDWPRVAFAAAVEDTDPDRAEFIRLQILGTRPKAWDRDSFERCTDLFTRNWRRWLPTEAVADRPDLVWWRAALTPTSGQVVGLRDTRSVLHTTVSVDRGFVSGVCLTAPGLSPSLLFTRHPIVWLEFQVWPHSNTPAAFWTRERGVAWVFVDRPAPGEWVVEYKGHGRRVPEGTSRRKFPDRAAAVSEALGLTSEVFAHAGRGRRAGRPRRVPRRQHPVVAEHEVRAAVLARCEGCGRPVYESAADARLEMELDPAGREPERFCGPFGRCGRPDWGLRATPGKESDPGRPARRDDFRG